MVDATSSTNQNIMEDVLKISGANRIGEFGIGTNNQMTKYIKNILFDEKIAGTIHIALGMVYPQTLSQNKSA